MVENYTEHYKAYKEYSPSAEHLERKQGSERIFEEG